MSRSNLIKEDLELTQLREAEQALMLRQKEAAKVPKKLAQEMRDRDCTMPPLADIEERRRQKEHDQLVSRGQVANIYKDQSRSVLLILLLAATTLALVWWGFKVMKG
jgi:hypothetical protein